MNLQSIFSGGRQRRELYRQGMAAFNRGDFDAAIAAMAPLTDGDTLHGRLARFYLSLSHRQLGLEAIERADFQLATSHLRNACRYNPAGGELARFLAVSLFRAGQFESAVAPLERAASADPGDLHSRVMLGLAQWRSGQPAAAELTLHQGLGLDGGIGGAPAAAEIEMCLGLLAAQNDRWQTAEQHLARSVAIDENNVHGWRYLGLACGAQDRFADSVNHLRRAQRLAPADPHIALELAYASQAANAPQAELRKIKLADLIATAPAAEQGEQLDRLARAIIAEPEFIQAFLDLPDSQMDQQIFSVLSLSLARASAARPSYADLHYYTARVNRRLGNVGGAIESVEQALAINPRYVSALILAAGLYHETAQRGASADRLRRAIAAGGDYPDVHLLLGHLYRELGQVDRARRSYERALKLKPAFEPAVAALATLAA